MAHPKVSQKRARALSSALLLVSLAVVSFTGVWWPNIMLAIGIPLALRQYLLGRIYDMFLSLVIFVGAYIVAGYQISWDVLLPVLFGIGAIYILVREFCDPFPTTEAEDEESLNNELAETDEDNHQNV